ncbi:MAG: vitamin K epoxide reductase family protein [Patescibacteria group bacterium]
MKSLKQLLKQPLKHVSLRVTLTLFVVALLGFVDAAYLTIEHFQGKIPPCTVGGCEAVLTSTFSTIAGMPVSLGGAIYYLILLIGIFAYFDLKNPSILKWTLALSIPAFILSMWFVVVQLFILRSICIYCMGSAITTTILFALTMWIYHTHRAPELEITS